MSANAKPYDDLAPLSPGEETELPIDPKFRDACYDLIRKVCKDAIFGNEFFSESEKWGKIFRVDLTFPDWNWPTRINRAVCAQKKDAEGISINLAIGQKVAPLPPLKKSEGQS